ncbi:hypothetical protein HN937_13490 [Candidatus Poribacteria bacterium]|nr:hypothetical protein [Candidatus Poribacteria bacterium]
MLEETFDRRREQQLLLLRIVDADIAWDVEAASLHVLLQHAAHAVRLRSCSVHD